MPIPAARHQPAAVRRPGGQQDAGDDLGQPPGRAAHAAGRPGRRPRRPTRRSVKANTLVPPRCDCGGVATAIVPGGRGLSQAVRPRTAVSSGKVQLDAVRRLKSALARRGEAGRKKKRDRKCRKARAATARPGPMLKKKAHFVFKNLDCRSSCRPTLTPSPSRSIIAWKSLGQAGRQTCL